MQLTSQLSGKRPLVLPRRPAAIPPGLEIRIDNAPAAPVQPSFPPHPEAQETDLGWREAKPGTCVFRGESHTGKQVEVFAMRHGRLECFWSNGEHWAYLEPARMRRMVEDALARDAFPGLLGY